MKTLGEIVFDEDGTRTTGEVVRVTKSELGRAFGSDRRRRLVVELRDGDVILLRPHRCRNGAVEFTLRNVYRYGLLLQAQRRHLEKARTRKAALARRREARRIAAAERRLVS